MLMRKIPSRRHPWTGMLLAGSMVGAAMLPGCGGDSTGPDNEPFGVTGTWSYQASQLEGSGEEHSGTCAATAASLLLTQSGSTVTGQAQGVHLSCDFEGLPVEFTADGPISSGTVDGGTISLHFESHWRHAGTVSGSSMSGTVELDVSVNDDDFTLEGVWGAQRQSGSQPQY